MTTILKDFLTITVFLVQKIIRGINWVFVIGLILFGLVLSVTFFYVGLTFVIVGIIISPFINDLIDQKISVNYPPNIKVIVVLLGFIVAIVSLMYETEENLFLARFLIQTVNLNEENKENLEQLRAFLDREKLEKRKKAYFAVREKLLTKLQILYDNGHYQEVILQGTPYIQFDIKIIQWVKEANHQLKQQQIEIALKKVPQLMKGGKYKEAYHLAAPLDIPELQKFVAQAKQQIEKEIKNLRQLYERGYYQNVIEIGTPYVEMDCQIKRLVNNAKKAETIQKTSHLIKSRQYSNAIEFASQSEYFAYPQMQKLIEYARFKQKKVKEKKILAKLRDISPTQIGANLREYTNLVKLFPNNEKYQQKLAYYKEQLAALKK